MGSQPTGRGYASSLTDMLGKGPLWAAYKTMTVTRPKVGKQKLVTMVTGFLGNNFPGAYNYNVGFPFTTMTVLARNTGTVAGNPKVTTVTAKGGDTVTGMGKRNISARRRWRRARSDRPRDHARAGDRADVPAGAEPRRATRGGRARAARNRGLARAQRALGRSSEEISGGAPKVR
jgi:hypothetical protein